MIKVRRVCTAQTDQLGSDSVEKTRSITRSRQVFEGRKEGNTTEGPTGLDKESQLVVCAWWEN